MRKDVNIPHNHKNVVFWSLNKYRMVELITGCDLYIWEVEELIINMLFKVNKAVVVF